jgi:hypothetical protein
MKTTFLARCLPVWPFHALGLVAVVLGGTFVVGWWPAQYPAESALVKLSGEVDRIVVRDDISGTTAGAMLPGWTSTYFTLDGVEGEFRYPRTHPKSLLVRDQTSGALEVWVERTAIGSVEPMIIWQIREHNPYKKEHQDTLGEETFDRSLALGAGYRVRASWCRNEAVESEAPIKKELKRIHWVGQSASESEGGLPSNLAPGGRSHPTAKATSRATASPLR